MFIPEALKMVFHTIEMIDAFIADLLDAEHFIICAQLFQYFFIALYAMQPCIRLMKFGDGDISTEKDLHALKNIDICKGKFDLFQGHFRTKILEQNRE